MASRCKIEGKNLNPNDQDFSPLTCESGSLISDPRFGGWCSDFHYWNDPLVYLNPANSIAMGGNYSDAVNCESAGAGVCCLPFDVAQNECAGGCESADSLGACCANFNDGSGLTCHDGITESACATADGNFLPNRICDPANPPEWIGEVPLCLLPVEMGGECDTNDPRCDCSPDTWNTGPGAVDCTKGACCSAVNTCQSYSPFGGEYEFGSGKGTCCLKYQCDINFNAGDGSYGACCLDGDCLSDLTYTDCAAFGGVFYGPNSDCDVGGDSNGKWECGSDAGSSPAEIAMYNGLYNTCIVDMTEKECDCLVADYIAAGATDCVGDYLGTGGYPCCEYGDCCYRGANGCPPWVDCEGFGNGQSDLEACCCTKTWTGLQDFDGDEAECHRGQGEPSIQECSTGQYSECSGSTYTPGTGGGTCVQKIIVSSCDDCGGGGNCSAGAAAASDSSTQPCCSTVPQNECTGNAYWQGPGSSCTDASGIENEGCGINTCRHGDGCTPTSAYACWNLYNQTSQGDFHDDYALGFWEYGEPTPCNSDEQSSGSYSTCGSPIGGCCKILNANECDAIGGTWQEEGDCIFSPYGDQGNGWCGTCSDCEYSSSDDSSGQT